MSDIHTVLTSDTCPDLRCFVSDIHTVLTSDTCPDLRCFVSDIHTVLTSNTCPDLRCFVANTFYIHIQYLEILVLISGVSCQIHFIFIYSTLRYLS